MRDYGGACRLAALHSGYTDQSNSSRAPNKTSRNADFNLGSSRLVQDYKNVIKSAISFEIADTDDGDVVLLAVRTPDWTGASMMQAFVEYDGDELHFEFKYWEADPTPKIEH